MQKVLFVPMKQLSVLVMTRVVNLRQVGMAAVSFQRQFAVRMESIAAQKDTPAIPQLELVLKDARAYHCYQRCLA